MTTILVVEDDRELVDLLNYVLRRAGFSVLPAHDVLTALRLLEQANADLALLDVNLGAGSGLDVLKELRRRSQIPAIMLTGRGAEDDKVQALELGADDYVLKPFSHRELVARVRAHLRRTGQRGEAPEPVGRRLELGPIALDIAEHTATKDGRRLDLTVTEFRLLQFLMTNAGTVVPTRTILKQVWGYDDPGATDVVRVTVYRLRRKLED
ncbi:MAG: response regulator transcription factor, partial [Chloroflexota bacterium]|nr:response regulator transcription factor [Chloroflexota bacterium]